MFKPDGKCIGCHPTIICRSLATNGGDLVVCYWDEHHPTTFRGNGVQHHRTYRDKLQWAVMSQESKIPPLEIRPVYYSSIHGVSLFFLPLQVVLVVPLLYGFLILEIYSHILPERVADWLLGAALIALFLLWIRVILALRRFFQVLGLRRKQTYGKTVYARTDQLHRSIGLDDGFRSKFYKSAVNRLVGCNRIRVIDEKATLGKRASAVDIWGKTTEYRLFEAQAVSGALSGLFFAGVWALTPIKRATRAHYYTVFEAKLRGACPPFDFRFRAGQAAAVQARLLSVAQAVGPESLRHPFYHLYAPGLRNRSFKRCHARCHRGYDRPPAV